MARIWNPDWIHVDPALLLIAYEPLTEGRPRPMAGEGEGEGEIRPGFGAGTESAALPLAVVMRAGIGAVCGIVGAEVSSWIGIGVFCVAFRTGVAFTAGVSDSDGLGS